MTLITCKDASFAYEGIVAVSELNFEVKTGDYVCVVGENGSGKSTLIKGLLRLKTPHNGSVLMGDGLESKEIGYLPQQTAAQKDFPASVREIVLSGRLGTRGIRPFYSKKDKSVAKENIKRMGMWSDRNRCYRELSGGRQQRVLLARALCAAKKLLVLDEPAAGLDPPVTQELYRIIDRLYRDMGIAVVMVSHDIQSATKYAGHILHLNKTQVFFGTTADYLKSGVGFAGGECGD